MSKIKKILITGGYGMLGKNIRDAFQNTHYEILAPTHAELDLVNENNIQQCLITYKPDLVIHCAGLVGGIQANIADQTHFLVKNLRLGMNIISGAMDTGIKNFINISSSCIYPDHIYEPLQENMILTGSFDATKEGYALAKCVSTKLCEYISHQYPEFQYKSLIPCNLYGKYDKFKAPRSHMIPSIIHKIDTAINKHKSEVEIWGDGHARREFMYAGDFAELILDMVNRFDEAPHLMNIGLGHDYSVNEYYETVAKILGYTGNFTHNMEKPVGQRCRILDISKQLAFGFKPRHTLEEGVRKTYEWYKSI